MISSIVFIIRFGNNHIKNCSWSYPYLSLIWNKTIFGKCKQQIKSLESQLQLFQSDNNFQARLKEEQLKQKLQQLKTRLKFIWRQKSRELWLKFKDGKTNSFHLSTINHSERNIILTLLDGNNNWIWEINHSESDFQTKKSPSIS